MNASNVWQLFDFVAAGCFSQLALALGHFLWQGCAVAVLYAIAARILRPATANTRYLAGVVALLLMAACMPATLLLIPSAQTTPVLETNNRIDVAATSIEPFERVDETVLAPEVLDSPAMQMPPDAIDMSPAPPSAQESAEDRMAAITAWALPCTSVLYLCGVATMLARVGLGLWGGRRLRRDCTPLTDKPIIDMAADHARHMGMRAVPLIAACSRVGVPLVVGILRPMILLPTSLISGLTPNELEAVLVHELAHIRRFDPLVNVLQRLVEAMLFFHPAVWWLSRRVSTERENACDDLVLRTNCGRDQYAQALVHMAELCMAAGNRTMIESSALAATGKNDSQFRRRVLRILNHGDKVPVRLTMPGILISIILILSLLLAPAAWRGIAWAECEVDKTVAEAPAQQRPSKSVDSDNKSAKKVNTPQPDTQPRVLKPGERKKLTAQRKKQLDAVKQKTTIRSAKWKQVLAADAKLPPLDVSDLLREYDKVAAAGAELRSWEARCRVTSEMSNIPVKDGIPSFLNESDCYTTTHTILFRSKDKKWFSERRQGNWQDEKIEHRRFCDGENVQDVYPARKSMTSQPQSKFAEFMRVPESKCQPQLPVGFPPFLEKSLENHYPISESLPDVQKTLADPDAKILPWRTSVDGHTCYVVELIKTTEQPMFRNGEELDEFCKKHPNRQVVRVVNPKANPDDKRTEIKTIRLALDPQSGFMPARWSTKSEIIFTGVLSRTYLDVEEILCDNFRKIDKRAYVAGSFQYTHYVNDPQGNISAIARREVELEDFRANQDYGPDRFHFDPPKGYKVLDQVRLIGYSSGDSQEKIAELLAAVKASKSFYEELKNKPAPPLQGTQWINSEPIRLEDLRGKNVRLYFWNAWCSSSVSKLRWLKQDLKRTSRHTDNPEVLISIHPYVDGKDLQQLKDRLRKLEVTFPVMVDSRHPDNMSWGKTFAAYGVYIATSNVWIDDKGNVSRLDSDRAYIEENGWWMHHLAKKKTDGKTGGDNKPAPNENANPPKESQKKDNPPQSDTQSRVIKPGERKKIAAQRKNER